MAGLGQRIGRLERQLGETGGKFIVVSAPNGRDDINATLAANGINGQDPANIVVIARRFADNAAQTAPEILSQTELR